MRWEIKDEHLDLKSLVLEYQVDGAREWRKVPIRRRSLMGAERWDAGTADSLRVRGTVADKAGNSAETEIVLPEGTAGAPDFAAADADSAAPPIEQISNSGSPIAEGPGFPPVQENGGTGADWPSDRVPGARSPGGPWSTRPSPLGSSLRSRLGSRLLRTGRRQRRSCQWFRNGPLPQPFPGQRWDGRGGNAWFG